MRTHDLSPPVLTDKVGRLFSQIFFLRHFYDISMTSFALVSECIPRRFGRSDINDDLFSSEAAEHIVYRIAFPIFTETLRQFVPKKIIDRIAGNGAVPLYVLCHKLHALSVIHNVASNTAVRPSLCASDMFRRNDI